VFWIASSSSTTHCNGLVLDFGTTGWDWIYWAKVESPFIPAPRNGGGGGINPFIKGGGGVRRPFSKGGGGGGTRPLSKGGGGGMLLKLGGGGISPELSSCGGGGGINEVKTGGGGTNGDISTAVFCYAFFSFSAVSSFNSRALILSSYSLTRSAGTSWGCCYCFLAADSNSFYNYCYFCCYNFSYSSILWRSSVFYFMASSSCVSC